MDTQIQEQTKKKLMCFLRKGHVISQMATLLLYQGISQCCSSQKIFLQNKIFHSSRIGHSVASNSLESIIMCGGFRPQTKDLIQIPNQSKDCYQYQLQNNKWYPLPKLAIGVSYATMVIVQNVVMVIGGFREMPKFKKRVKINKIQV